MASIESLNQIIRIAQEEERTVFVFSAIKGVTDLLVKSTNKSTNEKIEVLQSLKTLHLKHFKTLGADPLELKNLSKLIDALILPFVNSAPNAFITLGEELICNLLVFHLRSLGIDIALTNATEVIRVNETGEYQIDASSIINSTASNQIIQGFTCSDERNTRTNIGRGGSDYTATLIAGKINASVVEIWSDVSGVYTSNPNEFNNTQLVQNLHYREAAELSYFGAKVLHPKTVIPTEQNSIPIILKNTFNPKSEGTTISNNIPEIGLKCVSHKDDIIMIRIRSYNMLNVHGYLSSLFQIFNEFKTPIDVITTSEVAVSLTIDKQNLNPKMIDKLSELGEVQIQEHMSTIGLIGYFPDNHKLTLLANISTISNNHIRMMSLGGSQYNMSIVIESQHAHQTVQTVINQIETNQHANTIYTI